MDIKTSADMFMRISRRVNLGKALIYPTVAAIKKAGFLVEKAGIVLRAATNGNTEIWSIIPTQDNQFQLIHRSDLDYDPELRSISIDRKVIASEQGMVDTPYGRGKKIEAKADGGVVVEFHSNTGTKRRYILASNSVKNIPDKSTLSITAEAKSPSSSSIKEMLKQYYLAAYGDADYAKELTDSFGSVLT